MEFVIGIIVVAILLIVYSQQENRNKESNKTRESRKDVEVSRNRAPSIREESYYIGEKVISLYQRKGYEKFPIRGAHYRNLPIEMVGKFNGYAIAQRDNEYDPYAIAIYNDSGVHLGFIPRGNYHLHQYISEEGGRVHAYGYLQWVDGMRGEVCVETDKRRVTKRNKPYDID